MLLYLIRHAQSANNALGESHRVSDPSITDLGFQQADLLADWIDQSISLDRIYTSAFWRTLQTTQPIAEQTGLEPQIWVDIHEVGGCYSGRSYDQYRGDSGMNHIEIRQKFPNYSLDPAIDENGWWKKRPYETYAQAEERATHAVAKTLDDFAHTELKIALVIHAEFKLLFMKELVRQTNTDEESFFECPMNTSVSCIELSKPDSAEVPDSKIHFYNSVQHLHDDAISS